MRKPLEELSIWQSVSDFERIIDALSNANGEDVVTSPNFGFWRDGWIALHTAKALCSSEVRLLHPEPRPDFAVRNDEGETSYEATELLKADRRRHDDFRASNEKGRKPEPNPVEEWVKPEAALKQLKLACDKKAAKDYPAGCKLVIYVNIGFINGPVSESCSIIDQLGAELIAKAVSSAKNKFASVGLLHCGSLYSIE